MNDILTPSERAIYTYLGKHPARTIAEIVHDTSEHRPAVYRILSQLAQQNLVSYSVIGKRKLYSITGRSELERVIEQSQNLLSQKSNELLSQLFGSEKNYQEISGALAITELFETIGRESDDQEERFSIVTAPLDTVVPYLSSNYRKNRDQKNLWNNVITTQKIIGKEKFTLQRAFIDAGNFPENCLLVSFHNKIAFVNFTNETGYIISDAHSSRMVMELLKVVFNAQR